MSLMLRSISLLSVRYLGNDVSIRGCSAVYFECIVLTPLARDLRDDNFGRDLVYPFLDIERIQKIGWLDYDVTPLANEIGSSL